MKVSLTLATSTSTAGWSLCRPTPACMQTVMYCRSAHVAGPGQKLYFSEREVTVDISLSPSRMVLQTANRKPMGYLCVIDCMGSDEGSSCLSATALTPAAFTAAGIAAAANPPFRYCFVLARVHVQRTAARPALLSSCVMSWEHMVYLAVPAADAVTWCNCFVLELLTCRSCYTCNSTDFLVRSTAMSSSWMSCKASLIPHSCSCYCFDISCFCRLQLCVAHKPRPPHLSGAEVCQGHICPAKVVSPTISEPASLLKSTTTLRDGSYIMHVYLWPKSAIAPELSLFVH